MNDDAPDGYSFLEAFGCTAIIGLVGYLIVTLTIFIHEESRPAAMKIAQAQAQYALDIEDARKRYDSAMKAASMQGTSETGGKE